MFFASPHFKGSQLTASPHCTSPDNTLNIVVWNIMHGRLEPPDQTSCRRMTANHWALCLANLSRLKDHGSLVLSSDESLMLHQSLNLNLLITYSEFRVLTNYIGWIWGYQYQLNLTSG